MTMHSLFLDSAPEFYSLSDHSAADSTGPNAVPVIDLANPDAMRLISLACESWGAFQVTGHGVPDHVLKNIESEARRLFSLPAEEKMKIAREDGSLEGYGGSVILQSFFTKQFWGEGFSTKSKAKTHQLASKLWLDGSTFCNVVEEYRKEIYSVSTKVLQMMLLSLGLSEAAIKRADPVGLSQKEPDHLLHLNWYPACPEPEREMGLAHHTDSSVITVLYNSTTGLQVLRNEDQHGPTRWVTVPLVPDSFIVLVGDLGHILSNGRFHNVMHRAMVNQTEPRLSVVYFLAPVGNVMLSPLVSGLTGKPVYRAVTWSEYLDIKHKIFYKVFDSIKLTGVEEDKKDGSAAEDKKDGSASEVIEEKRDGLASNLEEEKKVPNVDPEKDGSTEVEEEKKNGSAAVGYVVEV